MSSKTIIRLDKYLSSQTKLSRSDAVKAIYHHKVTVNGKMASDPAMKVNTETDVITFNGEELSYEEFIYYLLNKPAGVVSATEDKEYKTVCDLIPKDIPVFPIGRLDIDTEGLIVLTNDGKLSHDLTSPKKHVDKKYYAKLDKDVTDEMIKAFAEGFDYGEDKPSLPALLERKCENEAYVTIHEGKFHQVKRMFKTFDREVLYLQRVSFGKLILDGSIATGEYKKIKKEDII